MAGCPRRDAVLQFIGIAEAICDKLPEKIPLNDVKNGGRFVVGRVGSKCDVVVNSTHLPQYVSSKHAEFFFDDQHGAWMVRDLGSQNKVYVNKEIINHDVALKHGDKIAFGPPTNKLHGLIGKGTGGFLYEFSILLSLTRGSIQHLADDTCACEQPWIVQVLSMKFAQHLNRWRMNLSDGANTLQVLAAAELNDKFSNNKVEPNSIIRVLRFIVLERKGFDSRSTQVQDFEVMRGPVEVIGAPVALKAKKKSEAEGEAEEKENMPRPVTEQVKGSENAEGISKLALVAEPAKASARVANERTKAVEESGPASGQVRKRKLAELARSDSEVYVWFEEILDSGKCGKVPTKDKETFLDCVKRECVDAEVAATLCENDLEKFGITLMGHRRKLLLRIQEKFPGVVVETPVQARVRVPLQMCGGGGQTPKLQEDEEEQKGMQEVDAAVPPPRNPHLERTVTEFAKMGDAAMDDDRDSDDDDDGDQPLISRTDFASLTKSDTRSEATNKVDAAAEAGKTNTKLPDANKGSIIREHLDGKEPKSAGQDSANSVEQEEVGGGGTKVSGQGGSASSTQSAGLPLRSAPIERSVSEFERMGEARESSSSMESTCSEPSETMPYTGLVHSEGRPALGAQSQDKSPSSGGVGPAPRVGGGDAEREEASQESVEPHMPPPPALLPPPDSAAPTLLRPGGGAKDKDAGGERSEEDIRSQESGGGGGEDEDTPMLDAEAVQPGGGTAQARVSAKAQAEKPLEAQADAEAGAQADAQKEAQTEAQAEDQDGGAGKGQQGVEPGEQGGDGKGAAETTGGETTGGGEGKEWWGVGSSVEALAEDDWWKAEVRETKVEAGGGVSVYVFYQGGTEEDSEWLGVDGGRVRPPTESWDKDEKKGRSGVLGWEAAPHKTHDQPFQVGDRVRAKYMNGYWYDAKVVELRGEKFLLKWADGDAKDKLKTRQELRHLIPNSEFQVGDEVEGKCNGRWYACDLIDWDGARFKLLWHDGDTADTLKTAEELRHPKKKGRARVGGGRARAQGKGKAAEAQGKGKEQKEDEDDVPLAKRVKRRAVGESAGRSSSDRGREEVASNEGGGGSEGGESGKEGEGGEEEAGVKHDAPPGSPLLSGATAGDGRGVEGTQVPAAPPSSIVWTITGSRAPMGGRAAVGAGSGQADPQVQSSGGGAMPHSSGQPAAAAGGGEGSALAKGEGREGGCEKRGDDQAETCSTTEDEEAATEGEEEDEAAGKAEQDSAEASLEF